jgi:hypothetical protein
MRRLAPLLLALCTGCDFFTGGSELDKLRSNRDRWDALRIADYDFDYRLSCFCATEATQPVRIAVRGAVIASVINLTTGDLVPPQSFVTWPTIDSLFLWTERNLAHGYNLDITYDASQRFPAHVDGDIPRTVDDEFVRIASNFVRR